MNSGSSLCATKMKTDVRYRYLAKKWHKYVNTTNISEGAIKPQEYKF